MAKITKQIDHIAEMYKLFRRDDARVLIATLFKSNDGNNIAQSLTDRTERWPDDNIQLLFFEDACSLSDNVSVHCLYGNLLLRLRRLNDAIPVFNKALIREPHNINALNGLAKALLDSNRIEEAQAIIAESLNFSEDNKETFAVYEQYILCTSQDYKALLTNKGSAARALQHVLNKLINAGEIEKASKVLTRTMPAGSLTPVILTNYANALNSAGYFEEAFEVWERQLKFNPKSIMILSHYPKALVSAGQIEKACEVFDRALPFAKDNKVHKKYIELLLTIGRLDKACEVFEGVFVFQNNGKSILLKHAGDFLREKRFEKACEVFDKAFSIHENQIWSLQNYANAMVSAGQMDRACELFERSLALAIRDDKATLFSYAKALESAGRMEKALEIFERTLAVDSSDVITLSTYARALLSVGQTEKAFKIFERALAIDSNDDITLSQYAKALASANQLEKAFELFERALAINGSNNLTLFGYAKVLVGAGCVEKAFEVFERALAVEGNDIKTLSTYAKALVSSGHLEKACEIFERELAIDGKNIDTLSIYARTLVSVGRMEEAFKVFEQAIALDDKNIIILSRYANALIGVGRSEEACAVIDRAVQFDKANPILLATQGVIFAKAGKSYEAIGSFKQSLAYAPDNLRTLTNYGKVLMSANRYGDAVEQFEKVLGLYPHDRVALFLGSMALQGYGNYERALERLEALERLGVSGNKLGLYSVVCLNIGRLHYLLHHEEKGNNYFERAIQNSRDKDEGKLRIAMNILAVTPSSEEGIDILRQITEDSPWYKQATQMLTLNLDNQDFFSEYEVSEGSQDYDIELLNSALYHKVQNEISLLRAIVHEILVDGQAGKEFVKRILDLVEGALVEIKRRRAEQAGRIKQIPAGNYRMVIETISSTAHNISDFVNNEMAVLKGEIQYELWDPNKNVLIRPQLSQLLHQVDLTQAALNELKSINESVHLRHSQFAVKEIFQVWLNTRTIENANIEVKIQDGESMFFGDRQKIRGFIGELVENSIKHNRGVAKLHICLSASIKKNLPRNLGGLVSKYKTAGDKEWLYIVVEDNGKGISTDKKEWIFLPLKSTHGGSSGLGLFIIRRTLGEMNGYIRENGGNGARFELYIPTVEQ